MLAEAEDKEQIIARVAALDIGKAELVCCVRLPAPRGRSKRVAGDRDPFDHDPFVDRAGQPSGRTSGAAGRDGGHLRLLETGVLPVGGPRAGAVAGQRPRRQAPVGTAQTDKLDAVWLCKLAERQMLRPSFRAAAADSAAAGSHPLSGGSVAARTAEKYLCGPPGGRTRWDENPALVAFVYVAVRCGWPDAGHGGCRADADAAWCP